MERINNRKYQVTARDLSLIGVEVERVLKAIKKYDYGVYNAEKLELSSKLALRVVEGMHEWQWENRKGIRVKGDTKLTFEIYDIQQAQEEIDSYMKKDLFPFD